GPGARGPVEIAGTLCTLTQRKRGSPVAADEIILADSGSWELVLQKPV
ncbi:MAG: hypothetical protein JO347_09495, partial [Candidatus Eremiobacteraeota bacterium]|nr:hypothetical protein [Candidatus Eremiobacteraeota bacterium]